MGASQHTQPASANRLNTLFNMSRMKSARAGRHPWEREAGIDAEPELVNIEQAIITAHNQLSRLRTEYQVELPPKLHQTEMNRGQRVDPAEITAGRRRMEELPDLIWEAAVRVCQLELDYAERLAPYLEDAHARADEEARQAEQGFRAAEAAFYQKRAAASTLYDRFRSIKNAESDVQQVLAGLMAPPDPPNPHLGIG